jgi:DNA gyrase subunit B
MYFRRSAIKLEDCLMQGANSEAELFLVEGDSAAASACAVRDNQRQAVLAMQGKPLNALKANAQKVAENSLYKNLSQALSVALVDDLKAQRSALAGQQGSLAFDLEAPRLENLRYSKIILLFDPDADGIHCSALMQMFFYRWMRPLLDSGRIEMVQYSLDEIKAHRPRGLGSLDPETLRSTCMAPLTRRTRTITASSAQAAISVFGG